MKLLGAMKGYETSHKESKLIKLSTPWEDRHKKNIKIDQLLPNNVVMLFFFTTDFFLFFLVVHVFILLPEPLISMLPCGTCSRHHPADHGLGNRMALCKTLIATVLPGLNCQPFPQLILWGQLKQKGEGKKKKWKEQWRELQTNRIRKWKRDSVL